MQGLRIRARAAATMAGLAALLLAGCDSGTEPEALLPVVNTTPAGTVRLEVGDTTTVRAVVQNTDRKEVDFTSSAPEVASVSAAGLVTARAVGAATITVTSRQNPQAFATLRVVVEPAGPQPSVVIQGLVNNLGLPVDPTRVSGIIHADLSVERGNAVRLEVLVDTTVACRQTFASSPATQFGSLELAQQASLRCSLNTAAFDSATGTPRHLNGPSKLSARLVGADDKVLFTAGGPEVALANSSLLLPSVSAERQANSGAGLRWIGGSVTVGVVPVLYDRGAALARVEAAYRTPGGGTVVRADTSAPFGVTFPDSLLGMVTDTSFRVALTSATRGGAAGPSAASAAERYDSERPAAGRLAALSWVGAQFPFARAYDPQGEADGGVGRVQTRFFAGDPGASAAEIVARGRLVATGSDLAQAALGTYRLAALTCDALANCVATAGSTFGVDLTPPTLEAVSLADQAVNPGVDLTVQPVDDFSGFDPKPLEVLARLFDADSMTAPCGPVVEARDLPGRLAGGACVPDTLGSVIPVPLRTSGYYGYTITPFDRAGNRGATRELSLLVDDRVPSLTATLPAQFTPGEETTVSAEVRDNLDLHLAGFRLVFPSEDRLGRVAVPFALPDTVGIPFDARLSTAATAKRRFPFMRTLTYGEGSTTPRVTVVVDSLQVRVTDAAGLSTRASQYIPRSSFGGDVSTTEPFPSVVSVVASAGRTRVCTASCTASDPTVLPLSMKATTSDATGLRPFATVYFYGRGADGQIRLLGTASSVASTVSGTQSTYTFGLDFVPPAGLTGSYHIFAVGTSSRGNALVTGLAPPSAPTVDFFTRP